MLDQVTVRPTRPQLAIAAAMAWRRAEAAGRVQKARARTDRRSPEAGAGLIISPRDHFGQQFGVGKNFVAQAKVILDRASDGLVAKFF